MKFYTFILFASLIFLSKSDDNGCDEKSAESSKDCKDIKVTGYHCCYLKAKDDEDEYNGCTLITDTQYNNIKDTIKEWEKDGGDVKKLDCKSIYLELSILIFIFLLL
jgi:hypothetical protein